MEAAHGASLPIIVVEHCCADSDEEGHRVLTQRIFSCQVLVVTSDTIREACR